MFLPSKNLIKVGLSIAPKNPYCVISILDKIGEIICPTDTSKSHIRKNLIELEIIMTHSTDIKRPDSADISHVFQIFSILSILLYLKFSKFLNLLNVPYPENLLQSIKNHERKKLHNRFSCSRVLRIAFLFLYITQYNHSH